LKLRGIVFKEFDPVFLAQQLRVKKKYTHHQIWDIAKVKGYIGCSI
jgi:hypothetical protein